ncbi:hypothetical protein BS17DRAFT_350933 [Gyrodon lividus]|nr:hypothetical protein BS17DRAFT_350933 [Gyrodon lividus]
MVQVNMWNCRGTSTPPLHSSIAIHNPQQIRVLLIKDWVRDLILGWLAWTGGRVWGFERASRPQRLLLVPHVDGAHGAAGRRNQSVLFTALFVHRKFSGPTNHHIPMGRASWASEGCDMRPAINITNTTKKSAMATRWKISPRRERKHE